MAEVNKSPLFELPPKELKDLDEAMKRVPGFKEVAKALKGIGQDTTDMERDLDRIEKQYAAIRKFVKPATVTITEKK